MQNSDVRRDAYPARILHSAFFILHLGSRMIITIDGPAGTGKSTVAQAVAERLDFNFLDTGAMYRAIGLEALRRHARLDDPRELAFIAEHCRIEFDNTTRPPGVLLNGQL